ncbi:putative membrane protein [Pasteurella langaaensis DSM 22999]|uniref:UPF0283 membrane protein C8D76_104106 n=1 Tax=Alitibacter langaaensis DSM 22999 TaxID=1122935 RepID=A0A2U0T8H0_9PAST|nr:TIGR01620 family protein [Pasteurella langaaensis]PVX39902.1 putative membrane protein [Pasteurella langaaensis DSM 22999]
MNDKRIFEQVETTETQETFQPKKEFDDSAEITPDLTALSVDSLDIDSLGAEPLDGELLTENFEQAINPKPRWWKRLVVLTLVLFLVGTVAQSVQWLVDTWQAHQWIYFVFALVSCSFVVLGVSALFKEMWRLRYLRQHLDRQAQSAVIFQENFSAEHFTPEQSKALCEKIADEMQIDEQHPALLQWQRQINDGHSAEEIAYLFSQNVLVTADKQAKKIITRTAIESATVVAISPLAVVDMFFVAWRNIRLVNRIAKIYGIELGYFSRLRLMRLVLMNIAFTGATELLHDLGMDWISQDLTAKLSARAAQGIGVGLLTARLGIKAMEFCRPMVFQRDEKPRLRHIQKELLTTLKNAVLNPSKLKEKEKV